MKLGRQVDVDWSLVDLEGRAASIAVDNASSIRSLSIVYILLTYCLRRGGSEFMRGTIAHRSGDDHIKSRHAIRAIESSDKWKRQYEMMEEDREGVTRVHQETIERSKAR
jgi:hypothetical protein